MDLQTNNNNNKLALLCAQFERANCLDSIDKTRVEALAT